MRLRRGNLLAPSTPVSVHNLINEPQSASAAAEVANMTDSVIDAFVSWFANQNGLLDSSSMGIVDFPGHGRGAIALKDIPVSVFALESAV